MTEDPYKYFRVEARELSEQLHQGVLELEKGASGSDCVLRLFRLAHTLKGAARVVKQREIADLAHALEDRLAPYREGSARVASEHVGALLELVDGMSRLVDELAPPPRAEQPPRPQREDAFRTVRADVAEMDALIDGVAEAHVQLNAIRRSATAMERARSLAELLCDQLALRRRDVRAGVLGSSLAKTNAIAEELLGLLTNLDRGLSTAVDQTERELLQVRGAAAGLRLLPVSDLFTAIERAARDAAQSLGKRVRVETRGGQVRLEADALSALQGALVQLARNAVAHGIEPDAERRAVGKAPHGTIHLEIQRRGERVVFTCRDDGAGIDLGAVRRAAQRRGLSPVQAQELGPEEVLRLLLQGGITTSDRVTELSGRGVGLDVVRTVAERLGGEARIGTERGKGTWVELVVPASLASFEALMLQIADRVVAIPLDAVRCTLRVQAEELAQAAEDQRLVFEGQSIPFRPLASALGLAPAAADVRAAWSAVIVEAAGRRAAFGTDGLLGTTQVVLRSPTRYAPKHPSVAGVSLDAEGAPQLVLDPEGLVRSAFQPESVRIAPEPCRLPVLVIDDSLTTRMLEQSILESAGYEVELASSAEEGLQKAQVRRYALFLVDVEMPGMDGFSFVARTRSDPLLRDTPAILVTSRDSPEDRLRGEEVGARAYMVKSAFDQVELLGKIHALAR